jgi:putative DNA primase/helicase
MRRRFNIIGFNYKPASPDRQLEEKLRAEWPAILAWMIKGCCDWLENGLARPQSVVAATEAYFSEQDVVGQWLEDFCDVRFNDPAHMELFRILYSSWEQYAEEVGESKMSEKTFSTRMKSRRFFPHRTGMQRFLVGVKLKR